MTPCLFHNNPPGVANSARSLASPQVRFQTRTSAPERSRAAASAAPITPSPITATRADVIDMTKYPLDEFRSIYSTNLLANHLLWVDLGPMVWVVSSSTNGRSWLSAEVRSTPTVRLLLPRKPTFKPQGAVGQYGGREFRRFERMRIAAVFRRKLSTHQVFPPLRMAGFRRFCRTCRAWVA